MRSPLPPGLVVAGTRSGCGKTSVALALMRALTRRGYQVQGFKVGPDFIDPGLHALVTGRPSHNLDGWMCPPDEVRSIYARQAAGTDLAVVEGVMGLFDGFSATDEAGSTAQVAKLLGLPVILVVDAASMARSVAAMAGGYLAFDPDLRFAGVILNNTGSPSHAALLTEAMAAALPGAPLLAVLPRRPAVAAPSRHLGLVTADDLTNAETRLDALADWLEEACDMERVMQDASGGQGAALDLPGGIIPPGPPERREVVRLGVARDRAFCFYYQENFRHLVAAGAELVPFSPLADAALPEGLDGLYLGGGYPELSGERLAANTDLRRAVRDFCLAGRPVVAECGGFMYLMQSLTDPDGHEHPMAGVFPFQAVMGPRLAALGYRQVTTRAETPLGPAGTVLRGHEFHYSSLTRDDGDVPAVYALSGRLGDLDDREGFLVGQTLGSYVHLHFGGNPHAARHFVAACRKGRP
jgi:cobyrinic acid a,c-diamide synthase